MTRIGRVRPGADGGWFLTGDLVGVLALDEFQIGPITINLEAPRRIASSDRFTAGDYDTLSLDNAAL
jgi:hypothetical protein